MGTLTTTSKTYSWNRLTNANVMIHPSKAMLEELAQATDRLYTLMDCSSNNTGYYSSVQRTFNTYTHEAYCSTNYTGDCTDWSDYSHDSSLCSSHDTYYSPDYMHNSGAEEDTCCVPAGTLITVDFEGTQRKVEELKIGDLILVYDTKNKKQEIKPLTAIGLPIRHHKVVFFFEKGYLITTKDHSLYTKEGWKAVDPEAAISVNSFEDTCTKISVGDKVLCDDNLFRKITDIQIFENIEIQMYNLIVENFHNYYANHYLLHNVVKFDNGYNLVCIKN